MVEGIGEVRAVDERKKSGSGPAGQIGVPPAFRSADTRRIASECEQAIFREVRILAMI